jgi:signal transduction histidine kinase
MTFSLSSRPSIIRRLIVWMVVAHTLVIIGSAALYLWRGYDSRGNEVADRLENVAHDLAAGTHRTDAGLRMPAGPLADDAVDTAAVLDVATGEVALGSNTDLLRALDSPLRQGLTHGTVTLAPAGQSSVTAIVASITTPTGLRVAVVAHYAEMSPHLLDWVLHEMVTDILPIFAPLFLSTIAAGALVIAKGGLAPIRALATQAASLSPEALDVRLPMAGVPSELVPLILAFNAALGRVEAGFLVQRRFTANAAHELRTPLAVLKARCESLGETPLRDAVMRDISRMSTIVDQLLAIARIESRQLPMDEQVDVADVAITTVADLYPLAHADGHDIVFDQQTTVPPLRGNGLLLQGALRNVIENALRLSPPGATVEVRLAAGPRLSVLDRGPGVPPAQRQTIFEPFVRGQGTRGGGAGLGLAIAAEAARLHGGALSVGDRHGGGSCFTFDFAASA